MSFSSYAGLDFEDFVQDAECIVIEQEQAGKVFDTPEDRDRYILTIAKNKRIDNFRKESNRKRLLKGGNWSKDGHRVAEIDAAYRLVQRVLNRLNTNRTGMLPSKNLTARFMGTTMASDLIQWELDGLTHREIASKIFKTSKPTSAVTRKICRALQTAKKGFKQECLNIESVEFDQLNLLIE